MPAKGFDVYSLFRQADGLRLRLEHGPNKLLDFFDEDMLQLFDFELRPYRSKDSI